MTLTTMLIAAVTAQLPSAPPLVAPPVVVVPPKPMPADPVRLAKAERLLGLMHIDQQYDSIFARLIPAITLQVFTSVKNNVQVPAALRSKLADPAQLAQAERMFADETVKGFKARYPVMRAATAREYAAAFTAGELDQMTAFYQSPIGQKTLAILPDLQAKLMPIGMAVGRDVGMEAMQHTIARMGFEPPRPTT